MHIHLTARTHAFTSIGNEVLQDRRLSFTARGILVYLLSLPDGSPMDVRALADEHPHLGRRAISKAVDELIELGYYERRTVRYRQTGQVRTEVHVYDTPQGAKPLPPAPPVPASPGTGSAGVGHAGRTFPEGESHHQGGRDLEDDIPPTPRVSNAAIPAQFGASPAAADEPQPDPPKDLGPGIALLAAVTRVDPRLALSARETRALAPLAQRWVEAGVSLLETRALLTQGLPPVVHSARALLNHRLTYKLPAPRKPVRTRALAECPTCRDPLPRGQHTGICAACAGVAACPAAIPALKKTVAEHVAAVRKAARAGYGSAVAVV